MDSLGAWVPTLYPSPTQACTWRFSSPDKQIQAGRRVFDAKVSRYEQRSTAPPSPSPACLNECLRRRQYVMGCLGTTWSTLQSHFNASAYDTSILTALFGERPHTPESQEDSRVAWCVADAIGCAQDSAGEDPAATPYDTIRALRWPFGISRWR